jgi:hypothetical protein
MYGMEVILITPFLCWKCLGSPLSYPALSFSLKDTTLLKKGLAFSFKKEKKES